MACREVGVIRDAIRFHIDGLREDGMEIRAPSSIAEYIWRNPVR